jgi:hypothetical protein
MEIFNSIDKGKRVWSYGYTNHGPIDGAKINIPGNIGGEIIFFTRPFSTMDHFLYEVKWDSGHTSKHYFKDLEPIGWCKDWSEYETVLSTGRNAKLTLGPLKGFRKFEMIIQFNGKEYFIHLSDGQHYCWQKIMEVLGKLSIDYETEVLKGKSRK